jgi:hypothetical protein
LKASKITLFLNFEFWILFFLYKIWPIKNNLSQLSSSVFLRDLCLSPKWLSSIGRFRQICYTLDMKYKSLIILSYFWLHTENQSTEIWRFLLSFPQFWRLKISKIGSQIS